MEKIVLKISSPPSPDESGERQHHQSELLRRAENQRHVGKGGCEECEQNDGNGAAHERSNRSRGQRFVGESLLGQRPSIEGRRHGGRRARNSQHHRRNRAPVHRAIVERGKKHDRARRWHEKCKRKKYCDTVDRTQSRHRPDEQTERAARHDQHQILRLERDRKSARQ